MCETCINIFIISRGFPAKRLMRDALFSQRNSPKREYLSGCYIPEVEFSINLKEIAENHPTQSPNSCNIAHSNEWAEIYSVLGVKGVP